MQSRERQLGEWARRCVPRAVAYARALLSGRPAHNAEDVVQDALCRLLAKQDRYDLPADGDKLLFRSVSNACINAVTRRRELASLDGELAGTDLRLSELLAGDPADEPEVAALTMELAERIGRAIAELPPLQRAVISLRALDQGPEQIAEALELSAGYVAVLTHRARRTLAVMLADVLE